MGPAREEANLAVKLGPSDPWAEVSRGHVLVYSGRPTEAHEVLATALRLDPFGATAPLRCTILESVTISCETMLQRKRWPTHCQLISAFPPALDTCCSAWPLGRRDEAESALATAITISPENLSNLTGGRMAHYRQRTLNTCSKAFVRRAGGRHYQGAGAASGGVTPCRRSLVSRRNPDLMVPPASTRLGPPDVSSRFREVDRSRLHGQHGRGADRLNLAKKNSAQNQTAG